jgi:ATP:corrinoid adenosyltransferase BtuR/CobO/CobP
LGNGGQPEALRGDLRRRWGSNDTYVLQPAGCQRTLWPRQPSLMAANDVRAAARKAHFQKGLVIVNTGNSNGKTTAALGTLMRAWAREIRVGGDTFDGEVDFDEAGCASKFWDRWRIAICGGNPEWSSDHPLARPRPTNPAPTNSQPVAGD